MEKVAHSESLKSVDPIQPALPTNPSAPKSFPKSLKEQVDETIQKAQSYLLDLQKDDGHWCAELESNCTITAEYVFLLEILDQISSGRLKLLSPHRKEQLVRYFFYHQKSDGSWGIAFNYPGDVSTTVETYLALRILGVPIDDERLKRSEHFIRSNGGMEKVRIFTRINLALFGLFPWDSIPILPPEVIFVPPQSPVSIYRLSSWARGTMVPLFIVFHHKPTFALPNGKSKRNNWLDHLWLNPKKKDIPYIDPLGSLFRKNGLSYRSLFGAADSLLHLFEKKKPEVLRKHAVEKCEKWLIQHVEESGDIAGIFPPMFNGVLALVLNGHDCHTGVVKKMIDALERFTIEDKEEGFRIQSCVSPVWDTILSMIALTDSGIKGTCSEMLRARQWVSNKQHFVNYGDWKIFNRENQTGFWSFEYENSWYPDVDDTAVAVMALVKQDPNSKTSSAVQKANDWLVSMQNRDGGWAAFDLNNDKLYLNEIPFSDMDSLCDPSSPDLTARVLEALGVSGQSFRYPAAVQHGIDYLRRTQEEQGSWFGRWGVNYIYGTSGALKGLRQQNIPAEDPMIERAVHWLKEVQNEDGGWGECLESYRDKSLMGRGHSTASQTAWALEGLLEYCPYSDPSIERGIQWLIRTQVPFGNGQGTWEEKEFTGTGFPNHFYIRYHYYRHYFPLAVLGRYANCARSPKTESVH